MKAIFLLAVIHTLIMYQSQKNKAISRYNSAQTRSYTKSQAALKQAPVIQEDTMGIRNSTPGYASFLANKNLPVLNRQINY